MNSAPTFYLRLFGSPSIEGDGGKGGALTGRVVQRHRLALLALVALAPGGRLSRDKLLAYLWPESDADRARNLLNVATYVLRSELGEGALLSEGDDLRLNPDVIRTDAAEFDAAFSRAEHAHAVELYRSPFLDGFFLNDAPEFEQWASRERDRFAASYARALETLASAAEAERDYDKAVEWWKTRAAQDAYDSRVAVRLMQAMEASGNRAGALQHAAAHQRLLQQEFGIAPPVEVVALADRLRSASAGSVATAGSASVRTKPVSAIGPEGHASGNSPGDTPLLVSPATPLATAPRIRWGMIATWAGVFAGVALLLLIGVRWRNWRGSAQPARSIAVLPFVNLGENGDNDYFSDGLTEEITTGLSAVSELRVISRTSAMHYKGSNKPIREIARELNVAHILEGSVRRVGGRVRISAQLIDANADRHRWAQNYDGEMRDVLQVQEQIAREVVRALEIEMGDRGQSALVKPGTSDPEAYELYRRGRYLWNLRSKEAHERAIEYFRRAIARDSTYADAYAGIAGAYLTAYQLNLFGLPESEMYSRVKWGAERALALDDRSADAHTLFAVSLQWQRNWPGAEREFRRAIQLNPNDATAHSWYSLLLSGFEGRQQEALEQSRRGYELDPFAVVASVNYGRQCYLVRDYDCAVEQFRRTVEIGQFWARGYERLGLAFAIRGRLEEATHSLERAIALDSTRTDFWADLAYVQALGGHTAAAASSLQRARQSVYEPFNVALAYLALGQRDSAFAWLDRSSWQWPHRAVLSDPALDDVRSDPRFARLTARIQREMGIR